MFKMDQKNLLKMLKEQSIVIYKLAIRRVQNYTEAVKNGQNDQQNWQKIENKSWNCVHTVCESP